MTAEPVRSAEALAADRLCSRILVGVDSSPASVEAVRQAVLLADADTRLELLAAYQVVYPITVPSPFFTPPEPASFRVVAAKALFDAAAAIPERPDAVGTIVEARSTEALLAHAERMHATLIAVGGAGHGRLRGIVLGSTATELVHKAPCSVLIARGHPHAIRRIVVGVDGSQHSAAAYAVADGLAERLGAELRRVVAWGGSSIDPLLVDSVLTEREDSPENPVSALLAAAEEADLLVVGSRGLHGLKALGSVSERVAHGAPISTVIVR